MQWMVGGELVKKKQKQKNILTKKKNKLHTEPLNFGLFFTQNYHWAFNSLVLASSVVLFATLLSFKKLDKL